MIIQSKIRDILEVNNVDYSINPIMFSARIYTPAEYKIYVRKKDYEKARCLIKDILRKQKSSQQSMPEKIDSPAPWMEMLRTLRL